MGETLCFWIENIAVCNSFLETDDALELVAHVFDLIDRHGCSQFWIRLRYKRRKPAYLGDALTAAGFLSGAEEKPIDEDSCWSSGARIEVPDGRPSDEIDERCGELFAVAASDPHAFRVLLSDLPF